jgi:hypothetical protein
VTDAFRTFAAAVETRLQQGATVYGGASFQRDPADLAGEIEQELLDVCAWSFILWCRVRALREQEMETLKLFSCPWNCRRILHRWRHRQRLPDVREL